MTELRAPWPAVVLGIDPGASSGWSVIRPAAGELVLGDGTFAFNRLPSLAEYGVAKKAEQRNDAVMVALAEAHECGVPLVVVAERWQGGWRKDRSSSRTITGIGAAWGRWEAALETAKVPKRKVLRVGTSTWRARVIGGRAARTTSEWKAAAIEVVKLRHGVSCSHDEADAILLATWGAYAPEVADRLGVRHMRKSGWELRGDTWLRAS